MTTRTILFDSPFLLGFDQTRALIDRAAKAAAESYPPYNVEQRGERDVRITLAVAGFTPDDLSVTGCDGIAPGLPLLGLATIRVPVETVARRGVEVMRQLMDAPEPVRARHELHRGYLIDGTTLSVPPLAGA